MIGDNGQQIDGPEQLEKAGNNHITFIGSKKYVPLWETSNACAAIVDEKLEIEPGENRALIKVKNADLAMAKLLKVFDPGPPQFDVDIHSTAVVHESATIGKGCKIGAGCYVGKNVVIGNGVEIGANSCVDRGKFSSTIIGDGCKIDNLVQNAHNCVLGRSCIMAGNSGLAGSVTLGDGVIIGGEASIVEHLTIHSGAVVGGGSGVMNNVPAGKTVLGYPAQDSRETLKQWVAVRNLIKPVKHS